MKNHLTGQCPSEVLSCILLTMGLHLLSFPTFSIMIEGMIHRLGAPEPTVFGELRRAKSDKSVGRLVSWLVGHCTPVDAVDVTGMFALCLAHGVSLVSTALSRNNGIHARFWM